MSFPLPAPPAPGATGRSLRACMLGFVLVLTALTGCGNSAQSPPAPVAIPGQPAGTIQLTAGTDFAAVEQRLQDAVTAGGGTPFVVDHAADARAVGVEIPPNTVVIGGPQAAGAALLRVDQRAGAELPQRYLVRGLDDGSVGFTTNGADYVAAVSGVAVADARTALAAATGAVITQAVPGTPAPLASPLIGVTPANYLLTVFGSADVAATVDRLRRNADRGPTRVVAAVDLAAGVEPPPIRPTSTVFVSLPEAVAPLLAAAPSIGLDLPLRFVVWLDDQNRTQIGYPDVRRLAARHGIAAEDPNIVRLVAETDRLTRLAAGVIQ